MKKYHISQKVVCVDDSGQGICSELPPSITLPNGFVKKDRVYTVSSIQPYNGYTRLVLTGCPVLVNGIDMGWRCRRFRPLGEMKAEAAARQQQLIKVGV